MNTEITSQTLIGVGFDIGQIDISSVENIDIINIENPLYPNYLNSDYSLDIENFNAQKYCKDIIVDGAYIDLNPGSPEQDVIDLVKLKVLKSIDFAMSIGASEVIFLSNFLPMIKLDFYDKGFVDNSVAFWSEVLKSRSSIRISLCNTFEYFPDYLIEIVSRVNNDNFGLSFDIGHAFAYGEIPLSEFYKKVEPYCRTIYIHSNNGDHDEHLNLSEGSLIGSDDFKDLVPLIRNKKLIITPFSKSEVNENIKLLKSLFLSY